MEEWTRWGGLGERRVTSHHVNTVVESIALRVRVNKWLGKGR